jgi:molybdopterin-guanine dinucleotide biosynthesis protein A
MHTPRPADITGLVLCGGRGTRMGGVDKGLQLHRGQPLVSHAMQRLQPQVGRIAINANRNLPSYAALGAAVWPDTRPDYPGPLAGWLAGLVQCETAFLVTVPCDTPGFPLNLVARLARALAQEDADLAIAATVEAGVLREQPVFALLKVALAPRLASCLHAGHGRVSAWTAQQRCARVAFDDATAFFNVNTLEDLQAMQADSRGPST